jgi:hypothetical protein
LRQVAAELHVGGSRTSKSDVEIHGSLCSVSTQLYLYVQ